MFRFDIRVGTVCFVSFHIVALVGAFFVPFQTELIGLMLASFFVRMFGVSCGYHRLFSHRAFKTSRFVQVVLAFLAEACLMNGVLWWAGHHRHHHAHADTKEDIHSPVTRGFWWSHVGWFLTKDYVDHRPKLTRDWARYPEIVWLDKHDYIPFFAFSGICYLLGGLAGMFWAAFPTTVVLWHILFLGNSLGHSWGSRRFEIRDMSRNNFVLSLFLLGEGFHNNHHRYPTSARVGLYWWELDVTYYVLWTLSKLGIVWDLRMPAVGLARGRPVPTMIDHEQIDHA